MEKVTSTFVSLSLSALSIAGVWDANADFCVTNGNPNGQWSYGSKSVTNLGASGFTELYDHSNDTDGCIWWMADVSYLYAPSVGKSLHSTIINGVMPGELWFHPGQYNEIATVRWTAPQNDKYTLAGSFGAGDIGAVDLYIYQNTTELFRVVSTYSTHSFTFDLDLSTGDRVDFMVGNAGHFGCDSTPLYATIRSSSVSNVPSPAAIVPFAIGFAVSMTRRKKR